MGEPATPTAAQRAETLGTARQIVDAVRKDETSPLECPADLSDLVQSAIDLAGVGNRNLLLAWAARADATLFRLAQDLVDTRAALDQACNQLDNEGFEESARRLRELDLEVR